MKRVICSQKDAETYERITTAIKSAKVRKMSKYQQVQQEKKNFPELWEHPGHLEVRRLDRRT